MQQGIEMSAQIIVKRANKKLTKLEKEKGNLNESELLEILNEFDNALGLDPNCIDALMGKSYVYGVQCKYDEAEVVLERAHSILPSDERIMLMLKELKLLKDPSSVDIVTTDMEVLGLDEEYEDTDDEENDNEEDEENDKEDNEDDDNGSNEEDEDSDEDDEVDVLDKEVLLIDNKGVMTKEFYKVLCLIFSEYDEDSDGAWNENELNKFYIAVNSVPIDKKTIQFLKSNFHSNKKGYLTEQGFLEFYLSQTAGDKEETYKDLQSLGFNKQLQQIDDRYKSNKI